MANFSTGKPSGFRLYELLPVIDVAFMFMLATVSPWLRIQSLVFANC